MKSMDEEELYTSTSSTACKPKYVDTDELYTSL
jgi:hypothetical protein